MKLRTKIWVLPISAAAVFLIGCAISYAVGAHTSATLERLRTQDYPLQEAVEKVERAIDNFRRTLQAAAAEGDDTRLKDTEELANATLEAVDALGRIEGQAELVIALRRNVSAYQMAALDVTRTMLYKGDVTGQLTHMQATMEVLDTQLATSKEAAQAAVAEAQNIMAEGVQRNLLVVLATCLAALASLGIASKLIVASVWRDLGDEPEHLGHAMRRIADGDLSSEISTPAPGAHAQSVSAALAAMARRLSDTVGVIRLATDSITTASSEIAAGNQDLSARTEHTASNLQQTASAMEQLTGTVGQTAGAAMQARSLVDNAAEAAQRGGDIVAQVVDNMNEINAASRKITDIIGLIDGIAFQTNILALNAAVEAARAGEQGRGFAVVASEVRSLAKRSAQAAGEIKTLIALSGGKVETGAQLVGDAGTAMEQIVASVRHVNSVISEISAAASEQSSGIGSVNESVAQLDQMTQQNSALVEQSAAASSSLREQAERLSAAVAAFRLDLVQGAPSPGA
ncbi:methyl-accepting chemotaxis protein [Aquincola sp. MAHUQ-54]|uniref:Methyl-accepting chemotaxis protein n=1 Tax=Aquincola agrisoli TaxID=3119538 RepID=A0AAW9QIC9_9BURK